MINKRLIALGNKKPILIVVLCQLGSMLLNVMMIFRLAYQLQELYLGNSELSKLAVTALIIFIVITFRSLLKLISSKQSHLASSSMKLKLRSLLYEKLLKLGGRYTKKISTAEIIQVSSEGVDQLESYFGSYLPQFIYCMISPIILFIIVASLDFYSALVLFVCVPLIPISIIIIQKAAKKLLSKYWGLYAALGDNFLENVQGMTTLKIYEADDAYHKEMNQSAEHFRIITMKVLSMQLNSIIVMDTIAYGGSALGGILAVSALSKGNLNISSAIVIILIASEFFLPMRTLGSFFHIAMNGMAAANKMFNILDMDEPVNGDLQLNGTETIIKCEDLHFSYNQQDHILNGLQFTANRGITALVGKSGCGKSTLASILCIKETGYHGSIKIGDIELRDISAKSLHEHITRVADQGYVFSGTIQENLKMAKPLATHEEMINALIKVQLWDFLQTQNGLDTKLSQRGSNFSGGQRQRLNLARALLRNSAIYIFDEVTSNIDSESENAIMSLIHELSTTKTIILISHRLANVVNAKQILLLNQGCIMEKGTHNELLVKNGLYAKLFLEQQQLEKFRNGGK